MGAMTQYSKVPSRISKVEILRFSRYWGQKTVGAKDGLGEGHTLTWVYIGFLSLPLPSFIPNPQNFQQRLAFDIPLSHLVFTGFFIQYAS